MRFHRPISSATFLTLSLLFTWSSFALAQPPFEVWFVGDDGSCNSPDLETAISEANASPAALRIVQLSVGVHAVPPLEITSAMRITGGYERCRGLPSADDVSTIRPAGPGQRVLINVPTGERQEVTLSRIAFAQMGLTVSGPVHVGLNDVSVSGATALDGAGLLLNGNQGATLQVTGSEVIGSRFENNVAFGSGGGIYCIDSPRLSLSRVRIRNNESGEQGGGIAADRCHFAIGPGVEVLRNSVPLGAGGGLHLEQSVLESQHRIQIDRNEAQSGAGLQAIDSRIELTDAWVTRNRAFELGGGLTVVDSELRIRGSAGFECGEGGVGFCSYFGDNQAPLGGALLLFGESEIEIDRTLFAQYEKLQPSATDEGAAIFMNGGSLIVRSSLFFANQGTSVIHLEGDASDRFDFSFITSRENDADALLRAQGASGRSRGVGQAGVGVSPQLTLSYSLLDERAYAPTPVVSEAGAVVDTHCVLAHTSLVGSSNGVLAPDAIVFEDPEVFNFHLHPDAPAIDYCAGPAVLAARPDVDEEVRGVDAPAAADQTPGSWFDLGFDEYEGGSTQIFKDGFETGDSGRWSATLP